MFFFQARLTKEQRWGSALLSRNHSLEEEFERAKAAVEVAFLVCSSVSCFWEWNWKKIKFQEDMYEVGLCRHEITMTMIVRMRLVTLEFVASQLGWLTCHHLCQFCGGLAVTGSLSHKELWALAGFCDEPMLYICYASMSPWFMPNVFISLASSTMSDT